MNDGEDYERNDLIEKIEAILLNDDVFHKKINETLWQKRLFRIHRSLGLFIGSIKPKTPLNSELYTQG